MNLSVFLSSAGILCNIIGIILLFYFALSPYLKAMSGGTIYFHSDYEPPEMTKKRLNYERLSKIGLWLCITGGVLQLLSLFV